MAEESSIVKTLYDGSITVACGATSYAVPCSVSMDVSGLRESQREVIAIEARGVLKSLRKGKRQYPSGSIEIYLTGLQDATKTTILDFLLKKGSYSGNTSTTSTMGDVYTMDITLTIEGTDLGDASDHTALLEDCAVEAAIKEGEPDTITGGFTCYGTVSFT